MDRRSYLATLAAGATGVAGCIGGRGGESGERSERPGALSLPVPESDLERAANRNAIPAIVDPVFGTDWTGVVVGADVDISGRRTQLRLADDDLVVGVDRDGEARAYPLRVLNWHEVVNDEFGGPLLVTYCPLCGSAVVAERRVAGTVTTFGVSGLLWRADLVMYDALTESLWSQLAATAIRGARTGEKLQLVESTLTTWREWRDTHPESVVLRPPPESGTVVPDAVRDYTRNPYEDYAESRSVGIADFSFDDDRLHPKTKVLGIAAGEEARAYPLPAVRDAGVVNDTVGGQPVVVAATVDTAVAYDRRVDGRTLTFAPAGTGQMTAGGSTWQVATGTAVDGPHEGTSLRPATDTPPLFWFAWLDFHPETEVYRG